MQVINIELVKQFYDNPRNFINNKGVCNIPNGVTHILVNTFNDCGNIKNVIIPDSVTSIHKSAFSGCKNLTKITIPDSVINMGVSVFNGCTKLKSITLSNNLTDIKSFMFSGCEKLENITIPNSVTNIDYYTFFGCDNLKTITMSDNVTTIGDHAFTGCKQLKSITIPDSVTKIGHKIFESCTNLTSVVLGKGINIIDDYLFDGCEKLKSVNILDGVQYIGTCAFGRCQNLTNVTIPDSVKSIGTCAFARCNNLTDITIPQSVISIGASLFEDCSKLKTITICGKQINVNDIQPLNLFDKHHPIREYFYANKYAKQLKPFIDKKINIPVEILESLINSNILNSNKPFNCKHLCNELDYMFKNDANLQKEFQKSTFEEKIDFYKLANKMGAFSKDSQRSQKASSAVVSLLKDRVLNIKDFHKYFDTVEFDSTNDKTFEFLNSKNKNLPQIIELENDYLNVLAKIINNYDKFLECKIVIDHNGKPKKLSFKDAAIKLYTETSYNNITQDNEHIANEFARFSVSQDHFDEAVRLQQTSNNQNNILNEKFIETSLFEHIEDIKNDTENKIVSAQTLAKEFLEKKFTYEILNKQDPRNLILGAYCSCCANIASIYYGRQIAISSFTSSNVDNIVVKNSQGSIIAKGTIYVNRENGYGVINDFELNDKYKKDGFKTDDKQLIFNTFKRAVNNFVHTYNKQNDKPITKVNVGLGYNRLAEYTKELPKETQLLQVPHDYGFQDASKDQYTLYKNDEKVK